MKKLTIAVILCFFSQFLMAEESVERIKADLEKCKLTNKETVCLKDAQDRLSVLINQQKAKVETAKAKVETAKAKVIAWIYETSEDKLRGIEHFSAEKLSNEAIEKKENGVLLISLNSYKQEIRLIFLYRKFGCSSTCYLSYKFDDGEIKRIPVHISKDMTSLSIYNESDVKNFVKGLKENSRLIIEVPANVGNMQFEFSLKPNLEWSHF